MRQTGRIRVEDESEYLGIHHINCNILGINCIAMMVLGSIDHIAGAI